MLAPDEILSWDGIGFRPIPAWRPLLPTAFALAPAETDPALSEPAAVRSYVAPMRVNPHARTFLGPAIRHYGYRMGEDAETHRIMLEHLPEYADGFAPRWREHDGGGVHVPAWNGNEGFVFVRMESSPQGVVSLLYHELFHSIYDHLPASALRPLHAYAERVRDLHPALTVGWRVSAYQEPETVAFQHWATGEENPFGIEPPPAVVAIFQTAVRGGFAVPR